MEHIKYFSYLQCAFYLLHAREQIWVAVAIQSPKCQPLNFPEMRGCGGLCG